jgi:hypothetical protein
VTGIQEPSPSAIVVLEPISVADDVTGIQWSSPSAISVLESISVADDDGTALPVPISVNETITVTDSTTVPPDRTPPVLIRVPASLTLEATGPGGAVAIFNLPAASDPDDTAGPVTCSPASQSLFALGTTTVTCRSTDTHGNVGSATFTVTVADTTPPVLTVPLALTVDATSPAGAAVTFPASATDLVSGAVPVSCSPASGATFAIGTTAVGCVAQDAAQNTVRRSFEVKVLGPSQIIGNLIAALGGSFAQGVSLLQNASKALAVGDSVAACGQIDAFINQVSAQAGKALTSAEAANLLAVAADIRAAAGCR